jgi:hypothetical protein
MFQPAMTSAIRTVELLRTLHDRHTQVLHHHVPVFKIFWFFLLGLNEEYPGLMQDCYLGDKIAHHNKTEIIFDSFEGGPGILLHGLQLKILS